MLVGRESLIRLVGKRKRALSSPAAISLLHHSPPADDVISDGSSLSLNKVDSDCKVNCPVCGRSIVGSNYAVNSHLDLCLSGGTKRKASQRTLLQLDFFLKKSSNSSLTDSNEQCSWKGENGLDACNEDEKLSSYDPELQSVHSFKVNAYQADSLTYAHNSGDVGSHHPEKKRTIDDVTSGKINNEVSLSKSNVDIIERSSVRYDVEMRVLGTVIVGHMFYNTVGLWPGASISLVREPENTFDQLAIKALCDIRGNKQTVGHLPQKLARYISPLIDNYGLKVEGFVASLPAHPHDEFCVDLVCHQTICYSQLKQSDIQVFEYLWENSIRTIQCEDFRPSRMKYQQNFILMIREVRDQYTRLFTDDEKSFIDSFGLLSDDSQRLFIRLYSRKGPWFRMCNVCYTEVADSKKAIEELHTSGYVHPFQYSQTSSESDLREVTGTLTVYELREISKSILLKKGLGNNKKDDLIDCLFSAYEKGMCPLLPSTISDMVGDCVKISSKADSLLWRIQRLFFLNGEQDLSAFLLVDLGLVKYPTYACNISQPIFHDRSDFIAYEQAVEVAQIMDESLEANDVNMINRCIELSYHHISTAVERNCQKQFMYHFSASWVYSKVVTLGVSYLESQRRYEAAIKFLKGLLEKCQLDRKRGYWTLRLSVDLEHIGFANESLSVAEEGLLDPLIHAGSRLALQKRVLRLGKPPRRWKVPDFAAIIKRKIPTMNVRGRPLNCKTGAKNRYYGYDGEQCSVEHLALQYYASDEGGGWHGVHTESGIWLTIFGLLMWDILFADVPDVFRTRFQMAPLDLESDGFYSSRRDLIESRLLKIHNGMAEEILIISWQSHLNTACRGVNWDWHELSDLRAAVSSIGGRSLAAICRLLTIDYRTWSSGMPDLLLWRFHEEGGRPGEAKLVEVKGPRDKLSEQQRAWMLFLLDNDVDTEICQVSPM